MKKNKDTAKALENDLISRSDLKKHKVYSEERREYVVPVYNIDNAPTVEPQKICVANFTFNDDTLRSFVKKAVDDYKALANETPQGKWINLNPEKRGYAEFFRCSKCLSNVQLSYWSKECEYDFCPNCGADMRGGAGNDSI